MDSRGNRGGMQGKPYDNERGRPLSMLCKTATGDHKKTKVHLVGKGVGVAKYRLHLKDNMNFGRGKGQYLHHVSEGEKDRGLW
jgi:hypothetical protein